MTQRQKRRRWAKAHRERMKQKKIQELAHRLNEMFKNVDVLIFDTASLPQTKAA
jgi:Asp-tRNA(Asn)/Glu-tRNA(Gln) amidotransferase A subunit family amidase